MKRVFIALLTGLLLAGSAHADKRFYLCDIIGDGDEFNPYRPAVADYGVAWVALIPSDQSTGRPLFDWTLVRVAAPNHSTLVKVCDPMPDFPMDGKVSGINQATKATMKANIRARMGGTAGWVDNTDGYRDVVRGVGQHLYPQFNENNFDVAE